MSSTTKKRPATETLFGSPNKTIRSKKGLFIDGGWKCNCDSRLPALQLQVKKPGPNRGRWFYICQKSKDDSCGFFLWADDAKMREKHALLNNTRSEREGRSRSSTPTPITRPKPRDAGVDTGIGKRRKTAPNLKATVIEISDGDGSSEEYGDWPLTTQDMAEAVQVTDRAMAETPSKTSTRRSSSSLGPKCNRNTDHQPHTPTTKGFTGSEDPLFMTPSTTRLKGGMWDGNEHLGLRTPSMTPAPDRFHTAPAYDSPALVTPSTGQTATLQLSTPSHPALDNSLLSSILPLISPYISSSALTEIKEQLGKHELKLSGVTRGRDISRQSLKAKDREIAELKQQIIGLEAERELDRVVLGRLRARVRSSVEDRSGGAGKDDDKSRILA